MKRVLFDIAGLIARIVTGVIFVAHGWQKWQGGLGATARDFGESGVPMPEIAAGYSSAVEIVGGIFLILGLLVRPVALLLLIDMIGAVVFVHGAHGVLTQGNGWELPGALGALSLLFLALGGGRLGVDGIFHSMFRRRGERRAAEEELAAYRPAGAPSEDEPAGRIGGSMSPADPDAPERPASASTSSGRLSDDDMREIDALVSDESRHHREPPSR